MLDAGIQIELLVSGAPPPIPTTPTFSLPCWRCWCWTPAWTSCAAHPVPPAPGSPRSWWRRTWLWCPCGTLYNPWWENTESSKLISRLTTYNVKLLRKTRNRASAQLFWVSFTHFQCVFGAKRALPTRILSRAASRGWDSKLSVTYYNWRHFSFQIMLTLRD